MMREEETFFDFSFCLPFFVRNLHREMVEGTKLDRGDKLEEESPRPIPTEVVLGAV